MNQFKVSIKNGNTFELTEEQAKEIDVVQLGNNQFHLLKDNRSFQIEILKEDFFKRTYTIKVNEFEFEINISTPLEKLIKE